LITPFALRVPVFGMGASALLLGELLPLWKISVAALVMAGRAPLTLMPSVAWQKRYYGRPAFSDAFQGTSEQVSSLRKRGPLIN
jgi:hypothetical protein